MIVGHLLGLFTYPRRGMLVVYLGKTMNWEKGKRREKWALICMSAGWRTICGSWWITWSWRGLLYGDSSGYITCRQRHISGKQVNFWNWHITETISLHIARQRNNGIWVVGKLNSPSDLKYIFPYSFVFLLQEIAATCLD